MRRQALRSDAAHLRVFTSESPLRCNLLDTLMRNHLINTPWRMAALFGKQLLKTQADLLRSLRQVQQDALYDPRLQATGGDIVFTLRAGGLPPARAKGDPPVPPLRPSDLQAALARWRQRLAAIDKVELLDDVPDLDVASLMDAMGSGLLPANMERFFDAYVHDSMASFLGMGMDEHLHNSRGLLKWRRQFFGNREDAFVRDSVAAENAQRLKDADQKRHDKARAQAQREQWDREAREAERMRPR